MNLPFTIRGDLTHQAWAQKEYAECYKRGHEFRAHGVNWHYVIQGVPRTITVPVYT